MITVDGESYFFVILFHCIHTIHFNSVTSIAPKSSEIRAQRRRIQIEISSMSRGKAWVVNWASDLLEIRGGGRSRFEKNSFQHTSRILVNPTFRNVFIFLFLNVFKPLFNTKSKNNDVDPTSSLCECFVFNGIILPWLIATWWNNVSYIAVCSCFLYLKGWLRHNYIWPLLPEPLRSAELCVMAKCHSISSIHPEASIVLFCQTISTCHVTVQRLKTLVLLNCLCLSFILSKLELLTQISASNDKKTKCNYLMNWAVWQTILWFSVSGLNILKTVYKWSSSSRVKMRIPV